MIKTPKVSPSLEDYLETILLLSIKNGHVRVTDVATQMNISKPSVNKAINILKKQELVLHEHYGSLSLTQKGVEIAKTVAERHKVIKNFLIDFLKIEEVIAEKEACLIEHCMSTNTVKKLSELIEKMEVERDF